jgi:four helix bundle protein
MANIKDFRDLDAFKASRAFVREIGFLVRSTSLRRSRNLVGQMERASISVLSNFAEGAERDGNAEFIQFLTICKGSIGELRAQLIYCQRDGGICGQTCRWSSSILENIW